MQKLQVQLRDLAAFREGAWRRALRFGHNNGRKWAQLVSISYHDVYFYGSSSGTA